MARLAGAALAVGILCGCSAQAADRPAFCSLPLPNDAARLTCASPSLWPLVRAEGTARQRVYSISGDRANIDRLQVGEIEWRDANCHDEACVEDWYHTQIEFFDKMVADTKAAQAARAPDYAAKMAEYDRTFAGLRHQVMMAYVARSCFLRSEAWGSSIAQAYNLTRIHYEGAHHFDHDEHTSADAHDREIDQDVLHMHPIGDPRMCEALRNSDTMRELDALQYRATGGYH